LSANQQAFVSRGARLASIGLGDMNYARLFREETAITFPLLVDERHEAYDAAQLQRASVLHLLRKDNAIARKRAREAGYRQHRFGKNPFQLGGSFVFGPGNVDHYTHINKTFSDNAPIPELLAALP